MADLESVASSNEESGLADPPRRIEGLAHRTEGRCRRLALLRIQSVAPLVEAPYVSYTGFRIRDITALQRAMSTADPSLRNTLVRDRRIPPQARRRRLPLDDHTQHP